MFRKHIRTKFTLIVLGTLALALSYHPAGEGQPTARRASGLTTTASSSLVAGNGADDSTIMASICPIVFSLDAFPADQDQRYLFYGNAFFVNDQGYLVTAAHVVSAFREGGQPYILVGSPGGPHHLVQATLVAADWAHDVAVLRATPNPFTKGYGVKFLSLTAERPTTGKNLLLISLHPSDPEDGHSSVTPLEDRVGGKFLNYEFSDGETEGSGRELLAMSQNVVPGQSGSPVVALDSKQVVGIALGEWKYPGLLSLAATVGPGASPGAVLPIHYAIALLHDRGISWQGSAVAAQGQSAPAQNVPATATEAENCPPVPLSLVTTPYPPQALFGGEVALDALVDASGKLDDVTVVQGQAPFLGPVLDAARTWSFGPAQMNGKAVDARVGILFQFPQSFLPPLNPTEHTYSEPAPDSSDRSARPIFTTEPEYPVGTVNGGTVAVYATVDRQGQVTATHVLRDAPPFTEATVSAIQHWRFAPARQGGANVESGVVIVVVFRRPAVH